MQTLISGWDKSVKLVRVWSSQIHKLGSWVEYGAVVEIKTVRIQRTRIEEFRNLEYNCRGILKCQCRIADNTLEMRLDRRQTPTDTNEGF